MDLVETFLVADLAIAGAVTAVTDWPATVPPVFVTDPADRTTRAAVAAREAAGAVTDLAAPVHCSFGDCSTEEYLWQLVVARTRGAEALTAASRRPGAVDDVLATAVLTGLAPCAELWRTVGILRPAVAPASSSPRDELLALAGVPDAVRCPT